MSDATSPASDADDGSAGSKGSDGSGDAADAGAAGTEPGGAARLGPGVGAFGRGVRSALREVAIVVVLALVLSVLAKTFLIQSFFIPSDSMNNTLIRDDRVVVSKLTPRLFDLARGDVVVFEDPGHWLAGTPRLPVDDGVGQRVRDAFTWVGVLPSQEDNHLIKRVVGLPGDHVTCCSPNGALLVNGQEIAETYLFPGDDPSSGSFDITVPDGRVWVMGDHRSNSADSRYNDVNPDEMDGLTGPGPADQPAGQPADQAVDQAADQAPVDLTDPRDHTGYYGSVPIDKVVGRAVMIVWPLGRVTILGGQDGVFGQVPASAVSP